MRISVVTYRDDHTVDELLRGPEDQVMKTLSIRPVGTKYYVSPTPIGSRDTCPEYSAVEGELQTISEVI